MAGALISIHNRLQCFRNLILIQNSLEVANIPTSGGLATVICMPENLMYIKTIQNGQPTLLAYTIAPYEAPKTVSVSAQPNLESRVAATISNVAMTVVRL